VSVQFSYVSLYAPKKIAYEGNTKSCPRARRLSER